MANEDYDFIPTGSPDEFEIAPKTERVCSISEVRQVLLEVLHVIESDPDWGVCGDAYDEGSTWSVYEIAKRLNIKLEEQA